VRLLGAGALALACWFSWGEVQAYRDGVRVMERDFYGVVRTKDRTDVFPMRVMLHGPINHGGQLLDPKLSMSPSTYFGPTSGYGRVFGSLPQQPRNVGVIGLGAGALAAYARAGDRWVFYEIAPAVVKIAQQEFTFLKQSPARTEIVLGDGRLSLEREAPRGYDVLAIDAFSGDSIPMHLLTREAMALYLRHLKPDGVIVFQATNRFVDILPVIRRLADDAGLATAHVSDSPDNTEGPEYWLSSTDQVIVSRNRTLLEAPLIAEVAKPAPERKDLPPFTDDYYNLIRILK
jgi:SAM-dependent methyltransferase